MQAAARCWFWGGFLTPSKNDQECLSAIASFQKQPRPSKKGLGLSHCNLKGTPLASNFQRAFMCHFFLSHRRQHRCRKPLLYPPRLPTGKHTRSSSPGTVRQEVARSLKRVGLPLHPQGSRSNAPTLHIRLPKDKLYPCARSALYPCNPLTAADLTGQHGPLFDYAVDLCSERA